MHKLIVFLAHLALLTAVRAAGAQDAAMRGTSESVASDDASSSTESAAVSRKSFARQGQFPEAAAVLIQGQFVCSASIIADDAVLTAAICLGVIPDLNPEEVTIVAGDIDRTKGQNYTAKRVIVHPLFRYYPRQTVLENDIAIVQITEQFKFNDESISKIKLPKRNSLEVDLTDLEGAVAGWGAVALRNKMLQYVNVTISNQSECADFYLRLSPAPYTLDQRQMCSEATEDFCIGESGAGLRITLGDDSEPTLVGVAEPLADCPHPKRPEIYTRVSQYLDWIEQSLRE